MCRHRLVDACDSTSGGRHDELALVTKPSIVQPVMHAENGRRFACFPAAILAFIVDDASRFLMMARPGGEGWQTISGAVEANESQRDALLREVSEEAGNDLQIAPLGVAHAFSYPYSPAMSDMSGSEVGWFGLDELSEPSFNPVVPEQPWLFERAKMYADSLLAQDEVQLEPWR